MMALPLHKINAMYAMYNSRVDNFKNDKHSKERIKRAQNWNTFIFFCSSKKLLFIVTIMLHFFFDLVDDLTAQEKSCLQKLLS
jgi:hypothetical protein